MSCYSFRGEPTLPTDATEPAPPDAFGPFRVLHQVGAGTLGPVFRAYDAGDDRVCAIKWFRLDAPPEQAHRLTAALHRIIAAGLAHPHLVEPRAVAVQDVTAYLAMDLVAGDALDTRWRSDGVSPDDLLRWSAALASALDAAAAVGIWHGALHPRDVLVATGDVRLTGIGVAQALEAAGLAVPLRRPYAAPERTVSGAWDQRADVFSLAAILVEGLTGRRIVGTGHEAVAALAAADVPDAALAICAAALAERPDERPASAGQFVATLRGALEPWLEPRRDVGGVARARSPQRPRRAAALPALPFGDDGAIPAVSMHADVVAAPPDVASAAPLASETVPVASDVVPVAADPVSAAPAALGASTDEADAQHTSAPAEGEWVEDAAAPLAIVDTDAAAPRTRSSMRGPVTPHLAPPEIRPTLWPIGLALFIGLMVGAAGGFALGTRTPVAGQASTASTTSTDPTVATSIPAASTTPVAAPTSLPTPPAPVPPVAAGAAAASAAPPEGAANATLQIVTVPPGASVTINGVLAGRSPVRVPHLTRGVHAIRIAREGYVTAERSIRITTPSRTTTVAITLTPESRRVAAPVTAADAPVAHRRAGHVRIESRPTGAHAHLDGRLVGTTPVTVPDVLAGTHAIRLELDGFRPWTGTVRVAPGAEQQIRGSLER